MRIISIAECSVVAGGDVTVETSTDTGFFTSVLQGITSLISSGPTVIQAGLNELGIRG
jgi:hypothetical protein